MDLKTLKCSERHLGEIISLFKIFDSLLMPEWLFMLGSMKADLDPAVAFKTPFGLYFL